VAAIRSILEIILD